MSEEKKNTDFVWKTVMETADATIEIFTDGLTMTHSNGTKIDIDGSAFEFLKDTMNGHHG